MQGKHRKAAAREKLTLVRRLIIELIHIIRKINFGGGMTIGARG
jgi:hypothetical protein